MNGQPSSRSILAERLNNNTPHWHKSIVTQIFHRPPVTSPLYHRGRQLKLKISIPFRDHKTFYSDWKINRSDKIYVFFQNKMTHSSRNSDRGENCQIKKKYMLSVRMVRWREYVFSYSRTFSNKDNCLEVKNVCVKIPFYFFYFA